MALAPQKCPLSMALIGKSMSCMKPGSPHPGGGSPAGTDGEQLTFGFDPLVLESHVPRACTLSAAVRGLLYASTVLLCPILRPKVRPILRLAPPKRQPRPGFVLPFRGDIQEAFAQC